MKKRIIVTGASGFIGQALIADLKKDSRNTVIAIRRDISANEGFLEDHTVLGDITDSNLMRRAISDYEPESIFHLASQAIVRTCASDPLTAYNVNVMGTVNLLEAARQSKLSGAKFLKSIVISTSDKAYGHAPVPYTEDTPLMPKFTYETTKACQDLVCQNYFHNYDIPVKIARCSNIYGPGDPNWSRLIPNTIRRVLSGLSPELYSDVANYVREFVYIDDVVSAMKLLDTEGKAGEAYCVGGTDTKRIGDLVKLICKLCNREDVPVTLLDKAASFKEIETQYIDGTKIKTLGWKPSVSLEEGLRNTIKFYESNL